MPFKDPERRRRCWREAKARARQRRARIQPLLGVKIFLCLRHPPVRILGQGSFIMSPFIITRDNEVINQIEGSDGFGTTVFPLQIDFSLTGPIADDDDDE